MLNEEERAALARARASMALEGYPTTEEQTATAIAFVQVNDLMEKGVDAMGLSLAEALAALDRAWQEARKP